MKVCPIRVCDPLLLLVMPRIAIKTALWPRNILFKKNLGVHIPSSARHLSCLHFQGKPFPSSLEIQIIHPDPKGYTDPWVVESEDVTICSGQMCFSSNDAEHHAALSKKIHPYCSLAMACCRIISGIQWRMRCKWYLIAKRTLTSDRTPNAAACLTLSCMGT